MVHSAKERRVLVICAHSDDQAIGAGGYIAKLTREGAQVRTIIASFGEQSHPHLKEKEVRTMRVLESKRADRILGGSGVMFLGLREGKFEKECASRGLLPKLVEHVKRFNPDLILTHSNDDPHPDHRAVYRLAVAMCEGASPSCEMWTFDIWNLWNLKRRTPRKVIDITDTFRRKLDAIVAFKSQKVAIITLIVPVYARAFFWGLRRHVRYAEGYYRVR